MASKVLELIKRRTGLVGIGSLEIPSGDGPSRA